MTALNSTIVRVSIYDIIGREVKGMEKKLPMGINMLDIDTGTELSGGVYFIKVSAGSSVYTDKLINLR